MHIAWRQSFSNDEVLALHAAAFDTRVLLAREWNWVVQTQKHSLGWVTARKGGRLIGFVNVITDGFVHSWIQDVMVMPDNQRHGVGKLLVEEAVRQSKAAGCERLHVDFDKELEPFYVGVCGFMPTSAGLIDLTDVNWRRVENVDG